MTQRVYVGMSGGVDSSLTAALLVEQGYDVTGIYMKNWTQDLPGMKCPWADDLADAKRVAVQLGIDFKVFDFEREYKQQVVDYMIDEYRAGRTPNPDIMCNQEVKFKLFLDAALADGADLIATGHYARVVHGSEGDKPSDAVASRQDDSSATSLHPAKLVDTQASSDSQETTNESSGFNKASLGSSSSATSSTNALLVMAADTNKDQTYFLYRVTSEALAKTLFPLGDYTKPQVRQMAEQRGLTTAHKKDSQGICFVGQIGIREFLGQYVQTRPGDIVDKRTGQQLGRHDGAIYYTLGQRHGLNLGGGLPYYVVGKDMERNEIYVSTDLNDESLWRHEITLGSLHWIDGVHRDGEYLVRIRHRAPLVRCRLEGDRLTLDEPLRAIAPGQSAVLYDGDTCVGGGIIAS